MPLICILTKKNPASKLGELYVYSAFFFALVVVIFLYIHQGALSCSDISLPNVVGGQRGGTGASGMMQGMECVLEAGT